MILALPSADTHDSREPYPHRRFHYRAQRGRQHLPLLFFTSLNALSAIALGIGFWFIRAHRVRVSSQSTIKNFIATSSTFRNDPRPTPRFTERIPKSWKS